MATAHIELTRAEQEEIEAIARRLGKSEDEVLREAVQELIRRYSTDRLAALRRARGMWRDRDDVDKLSEIRRELDRDS